MKLATSTWCVGIPDGLLRLSEVVTLAPQTTQILEAGDVTYEGRFFFDKLETESEMKAAEKAELAARTLATRQWASLGLGAAPTAETEAAGPTSHDEGDLPDEEEVQQARRRLRLHERLPPAEWDQSGCWLADFSESEPGVPVLAAMGVPWILRGTVASLKITTDAYLRSASPPTALELREAGTVIHGEAWGAPGVWCTLDRTSYGDSRSIFLLDGACRRRTGADGKHLYARAWQVGVGRSALDEDEDEAEAWSCEGLDVAGPGTLRVLAKAPQGAIVTESVVSASVGQIIVVEARHPIEGGRRAVSVVSVFKPVPGASGGAEGYGAGEYEEEPEASQRRVLDNLGFEEREKALREAIAAAESIVARFGAAATADAGAAESEGDREAKAAAGRGVEGLESPACERRGSDSSSALGALGAASTPAGRARSSAPSSGAGGPAGRVSTALDRLDLSGQWRVDHGRSQPLRRAIGGTTAKLAAVLEPRLGTPAQGKLVAHHTAWQLRLHQMGPAGAVAHSCSLLLDGAWHAVPHGPGGRGAPYLPVKATQEASGMVAIETRLALLERPPADESLPPPRGASLHEAISQGGRGRSSVTQALTLVNQGGEVVGEAVRVLLREEREEERLLAESLGRRRAEEEAERERLAAAAAAEAAEEAGGGDESTEEGVDEGGGESGRRMQRHTRQGMELLLQSAVKDFFGERASVTLADGKAVLRLPARDEREASEVRQQGWRRAIGQVGLLTGVLAMAVILAMMPSLNKLEAVAVMACGMVLYAVAACMPCIEERGATARSSIVRRAQQRMEAGDEEGATEALLAEAAARALQMTMAERARREAEGAEEPAPTLPASSVAEEVRRQTAGEGGVRRRAQAAAKSLSADREAAGAGAGRS